MPGQPALQQLEGRFRCLAGMYKAHSQVSQCSEVSEQRLRIVQCPAVTMSCVVKRTRSP